MSDSASEPQIALNQQKPGVKDQFLAIAAVLLALVPAAWVILGRWYGDFLDQPENRAMLYAAAAVCLAGAALLIHFSRPRPEIPDALIPSVDRETGALSPLQRNVSLGFIILCGLGLMAVGVFCLAQKRLPGFELPAAVLVGLAGLSIQVWPSVRMRQLRGWLAPFILFSAALFLVFYIAGTTRAIPWYAAAPLLAAGAYVWFSRRSIPAGAWLFWLAFAADMLNLDNWLYTAVGDEYSFFTLAQRYSIQPLEALGKRLFECCAVHGAHPFFSSAMQIGWMKLLGPANFGWRSLNPFLCAVAAPLFFYFFSTFLSRRAAFIAVFCLACSSYLMSFSKIGYNNLQAYFLLALVLACTAWVIRARHLLSFACLGLACGLCFYVYPAALYSLPLPAIFLWAYLPPTRRERAAGWAVMAAAFTVLALPMLVQPRFWTTLLPGTVYYTPSLLASWGAFAAHMGSNLRFAFFSGWIIPEESHFVVSAYQDPLSAALAWLGLAAGITLLRRSRFLAVWLGTFFLMLVLAGASHDRMFPPTTRMFLLLPWLAGFAGLGLDWVISHFNIPRRGWAVIMIAIFLLNLANAYWLSGIRNTSMQSVEALFMRLVQNLARSPVNSPRTYLFLSGPAWGIDGFRLFQQIYPHWLSGDTLVDTDLSTIIPDPVLELAAKETTYVIETPFLDPGLAPAIQTAMQAKGKARCYARTLDGQIRFSVWYTPGSLGNREPGGPCQAPASLSDRLPGLVFIVLLAGGLDALLVSWLRRRRDRQHRTN